MTAGPEASLGMDEAPLLNCDLYLHWAIDTHFRHVPGDRSTQGSIGLLIEWQTLETADQAATIARALMIPVPSVYLGSSTDATGPRVRRIWAITVPGRLLERFLQDAGALASRIELAMPMAESGLRPFRLRGRRSETEVMAAVLDDGCAFANGRFRNDTGTRILWLWNQDPKAGGAQPGADGWPSSQANFGYGGQYCKDDLDDAYQAAGRTQDQAYQRTGLTGMRRRATHGAHVMDLLANTEPPWPQGAPAWDIVFVQFPRAGVEDPSGIWLKRHALDGLNYVLECAGPKTRTVVVNLSWGPQTGPHDGHSVLEEGIAELKQLQDGLSRKLVVALPSGNSFGAQAHACIELARGGCFDWHVPPDGMLPAFVELWWPENVALDQVALRITPPGAAPVTVVPGGNVAPDPAWWARLKSVGPYASVLVVVNPTGAPGPSGQPAGPHGRWHFQIDAAASGLVGEVHAYVARADHNMGAPRRAKASYLDDAALAGARFRPPALRDADVPGSAIRRTGTLNGMATGSSTYAASGYRAPDFSAARYSSAGLTRSIPPDLKPDFACLTDRSPVRLGLRATGSRTGSTAVLVGTSTAAPQLARRLALDNLSTTADHLPAPPCPEREGAGCLDPQPWLLKRE